MPPPPEFQAGRLRIGAVARIVLEPDAAAILRHVAGCKPADLLRRTPERGVAHAQWFEQTRAQEFAEARAAELLHQVAHHIDRHRVVPRRARRELQRDLRQLLDHRIEPALGVELGYVRPAIGAVHAGAVHEAVGQAGGMRHQVHHLHRPQDGRGDEARFAGRHQAGQAGGVDAQVLPRRDVRGDVVVEAEGPFLDQHHQRHRGDRLAHRIDAEDRILAHRLVALEVHAAGHAGMRKLAAAVDHGQHARQAAAIDVAALHHVVEARQA